MNFLVAAAQTEFITESLEIIVIILVAIEIVELFYNVRTTQKHEKELDIHLHRLEQATAKHAKELNGHMEKLQEATAKIDSYTSCFNRMDEHIRAIDTLLEKSKSKEK